MNVTKIEVDENPKATVCNTYCDGSKTAGDCRMFQLFGEQDNK
jgi:hypothetical protein